MKKIISIALAVALPFAMIATVDAQTKTKTAKPASKMAPKTAKTTKPKMAKKSAPKKASKMAPKKS